MTETLPEINTGLFIAGARQEAADSFAVHDPADPQTVVGFAGAASEEQARAAVAAAHDAFPAWAALDPHERAAQVKASLGALAADNDERVELLSRENGKVRSECEIEMHVIEARFELAAGLADVVAGVRELPAPPYNTRVTHLPLGVVSLIVPFNWPLAILAASLPQALVAGNTVVVKAPPTTPLSFVRTVELIAAELPPGVLNVVSGQDAVLGPVLIQDPRVRKVGFTGSVGAGKRIMAMCADNLTRVLLELGGNDPALVLEDAVIDEGTIGKLYLGAFLTTGQVCMAMKRLYVHRSHYDAVVEGLSGAVGAQKLGPGLHADATMGPLNSARQRDYVNGCSTRSAATPRCASWPEPVDEDAFARGLFMRPSLVLDPRADSRLVDRGAVRAHAPDHPVRRRRVGDRRGQRHLVGPVLVGVVWRHGARRPRRRAAADRLHVRQRPQRAVPRRARAVRRLQPERHGAGDGRRGDPRLHRHPLGGLPGLAQTPTGRRPASSARRPPPRARRSTPRPRC
jgi:acyl-CoA reductase-like NAD-dependent aldehyde dehydrogenase